MSEPTKEEKDKITKDVINLTLAIHGKPSPELKDIGLLFHLETAIITIVPIYLYGWMTGLLIYSALSSLLHIVLLLKHMSRQFDSEV